MKFKINIITLLMLPLIFIGFSQKVFAAKTQNAPNFDLPVINSKLSGYKNINLKSLRGKIVFINFWATWCPPCRAEIPDLIKFYNEHKSEGFVVVGINVNTNASNLYNFIYKYKINYPIIHATMNVVDAYGGIHSIPQTFVVNKKGKIIFAWVGAMYPFILDTLYTDLISQKSK